MYKTDGMGFGCSVVKRNGKTEVHYLFGLVGACIVLDKEYEDADLAGKREYIRRELGEMLGLASHCIDIRGEGDLWEKSIRDLEGGENAS